MTCIVAFAHKGEVWFGGDSAGVAGLGLVQRADEKVFQNGDFIFGFTSSFRMGQLLRYRFTPPKPHPEDDIVEFMSTTFIDEVRKVLKDYGYSRIEHNVEEGGTFLVGYGERIFRIDSDYQVGISIHPFESVGCGEDIALGVMHALSNNSRLAPQAIVEAALKAAEAFSAGVRGPFNIMRLGDDDE